jgi:hypothetical protein
MEDRKALHSWIATVTQYMPHLSKPQATVLALWSFGIVMTGACGLSSVALFLAELLARKENTVRQQLREWYREADAKRGDQRRTLDVTGCFAPLLGWVLSWWAADEHRLALAMDASSLGARFVVLAISVVYRGGAIPVAWVILPANQAGAWKPHWLALFSALQDAVPATWTVIVLADRGLYARWLYNHIMGLGWHPFLRINRGGKFRPIGASEFRALTTVVPTVGSYWSGAVICFKGKPLACTLLACWEAGYKDPWLILTDLPPAQADVCWYGLRTWIECGFKDMKRGGWQWQYTRMTDPERVTRFWLALAVATLWALSVGGEADATLAAPPFECLEMLVGTHSRSTRRSTTRLLSCFRRGCLVILAALLNHAPLPLGHFCPEPWPSNPKISNMHLHRDYVYLS